MEEVIIPGIVPAVVGTRRIGMGTHDERVSEIALNIKLSHKMFGWQRTVGSCLFCLITLSFFPSLSFTYSLLS